MCKETFEAPSRFLFTCNPLFFFSPPLVTFSYYFCPLCICLSSAFSSRIAFCSVSISLQPQTCSFPPHCLHLPQNLLFSLFPPPPLLSCPSTHLHVSLQLQQMETVPGDKTRALVGEVYASKTGLAWSQVGFTD